MLLEYKKAFALDYDISHYDAKDMLIHDLLAEQANDSNSSMFREDRLLRVNTDMTTIP